MERHLAFQLLLDELQETYLPFPVGVLQIWDVLTNGYWHARGLEFMAQDRIRMLEWASLPSHVVLIVLGVVPMVIAAGLTYLKIRQPGRA